MKVIVCSKPYAILLPAGSSLFSAIFHYLSNCYCGRTVPTEYWHLTKLVYGNKIKASIPSLIVDGLVYSDPVEKANIFNNNFSLKSQLPIDPPNLPDFHSLTNHILQNIIVTEEQTEKILLELDINKANGPDNISNKLLKNVATSISKPLTKLFNRSLQEGIFPDQWKHAHVCPVLKKRR